jgi:lysozyme
MKDLTARIAAELVGHEAIVPEAYKDSVGVWTWGVGVTDASGHKVARYKDKPSTIAHCLEIYVWLVRERYLPVVLGVFAGHDLSEAELGAALSFHYNTGAIARASWPRLFVQGKADQARASMLEWAFPASIIGRRRKEAALFFDGTWSGDGGALVYDVAKPAYKPTNAHRVPIMAALQQVMGGK